MAELPLIEFSDVIYRFDGAQGAHTGAFVVGPVNLAIYPGETIRIQGSNGSGKTTLLRLIAGNLWPQRGMVALRGKRMQSAGAYRSSMSICFATQNTSDGTIGKFTVKENLELRATLARSDSVHLGSTMLQWLEDRGLSQLKEKFDRPVDELSGGWRQILQVASCAYADPDILLLDEPIGNLAPRLCTVAENLISALPNHTSIVYTTHQAMAVKRATTPSRFFNMPEPLGSKAENGHA